MRIAFVVPWFRTLAHLYGRLLVNDGHQVLIVTGENHFEDGFGFCEEILAERGSASPVGQLRNFAEGRRRLHEFDPHVVIEDVFLDPRWLMIAPKTQRIVMVHDPSPHDTAHKLRPSRELVARLQGRRADGYLCFSEFAKKELAAIATKPVGAVSLISEMPDELVRPGPTERRGFLVVGRFSDYKGMDVALDSWSLLSQSERRDHPLIMRVSQDTPEQFKERATSLPNVDAKFGSFSFPEIAEVLSRVHGALLPYRKVSQSGVQLMALQSGVTPIVSNIGALPEYQPSRWPPLSNLVPAEWAQMMRQSIESKDDDAPQLIQAHYSAVSRRHKMTDALGQMVTQARA
jgi:glycosyltransferase involved in cell wall biosynthesis